MRGRIVVVQSLAEFDRRRAAGAERLTGWRVIGVDLSERSDSLMACDPSRTTFIGCAFEAGMADRLTDRGALVLPAVGNPPVPTHRDELYTATDLYDTAPYRASTDARAYAWSQRPGAAADPNHALAQVLHDAWVDAALTTWIQNRSLVGVMGGHAAQRGTAEYAAAARLGHLLGGRHVVATGGGPGAMEAANLGARLADPDLLDRALPQLAQVPSFRPSVDEWAQAAFAVIAQDGPGRETLGVPTWHYGHEPPNVFATAIAKYFRNAQREAILLQICNAGIVVLPGAAGTVQEIFQDACENYYAAPSSVAPMILVGVEYWTRTLPAWPLLQSLSQGRAMEPHIHLVDDVAQAAALLV